MNARLQEQIEFHNGFAPSLVSSDKDDLLDRYELLRELQKRLDPSEVLITLLNAIGDRLGVVGLRFEADEAANPAASDAPLDLALGRNFGEAISLEVRAGDELLGMLTLYGVRAHLIGDLRALDRVVECLAFPLRNALLYRAASALARRDALTGAGSRLAFDEALAKEMSRAERSSVPFSLLIIDVNNFKQVNDEFGHLSGDHTLCLTRRLVEQELREGDACFRIGGDEFAVLLHRSDIEGALTVSARIRRAIESQTILSPFSVAVGMAQWRAGLSRDAIIARADQRMYKDKSGRGDVESDETSA
ncbi:MAG: GGDEF domain-containing protein [Wenzhouxiangellaceae bacterium]|nr:GGDEF domain-containing protein [Wenzhouxiangellaceae bacterium]